MSTEEITITIDETGEPTISVAGVIGQSCKSLTAAIENALGSVTSDENTKEFYVCERNNIRDRQAR